MRSVLLSIFFLLLISCSNSADKNNQSASEGNQSAAAQQYADLPVDEAINKAIDNDDYEEALKLLQQNEDIPMHKELLEKTHLNYGLYMEYRGEGDMRSRMTGALRQFIKTLQVNPDNPKARAEVDQIMSVYQTIPNKNPPQGILDTLNQMNLR